MTGSKTTPGTVTKAHAPETVENYLLGPLAQQFTVQRGYPFADNPFADNAITAIWRNETGDAT